MTIEQKVPEIKGVTVKKLAALDLGPEIEGMACCTYFKERSLTIEME